MHVVQVDGVDAEVLQARLCRLANVFWGALDREVGRVEPELGRKEDVLALFGVAGQPMLREDTHKRESKRRAPFANELLRVVVDVGSVPESAARGIDRVKNLLFVNDFVWLGTTRRTLKRSSSDSTAP